MTLTEVIAEIHHHGYEADVYSHLCDFMASRFKALYSENCGLKAQMRAIKKINNGKNEAIDALCERD